VRRQEGVFREADQAGAVKEGAPDLEGGGVEGRVGSVRDAVGGGEVNIIGVDDEADDGAVRDGDALRGAGRAGGEHDVSERIGEGRAGRVEVAEGGGEVFERVERDGRGEVRGEVGGGGGMGEDELSAGEAEDEREAVRRWRGIEREVSVPGLEDGEHGDDGEGGRVQADGDEGLGREAKGEDEVSEAVGEGVEVGEGELRVVEIESDGKGGAEGLKLKEGVDGEMRGVRMSQGKPP
jgi:hypothetical protein